MTRSEEEASKAYGGIPLARRAFIHGYEQAEKDLALTWEDIKRIIEISDELDAGIIEPYLASEQDEYYEHYEEVLRIFNKTK